jgi:hypothetical protein
MLCFILSKRSKPALIFYEREQFDSSNIVVFWQGGVFNFADRRQAGDLIDNLYSLGVYLESDSETSSKSGRLPTLVFPSLILPSIKSTSPRQVNLELETLLVNSSSGSKETWPSRWQSLLVPGRRFRQFVWLFLESLPKKPIPLTLCSDGTTCGVVSPGLSFGPLLHFLRTRSSEI